MRFENRRLTCFKISLAVLSVFILLFTAFPGFAERQSSIQIASTSPYRAGIEAYRHGQYSKALVFLKQAYNVEPANANVRYYMAVVLDKMDRSDEALPHYRYVMHHGTDNRVMAYAKKRVTHLKLDNHQSLAAFNLDKGINVPLKPHNNALMVEASLNDRAVGTFIVDTGATYTSISRELYEELGPENMTQIGTVRITTANGRIEVPKILIDRININGLEARNVEATVIDVRKSSSFSGLLGLSFLRQFKLTIDPTEGRLVFQAI